MTLSKLSRIMLVALSLAPFAIPSASLAQSRSGYELVNRPSSSSYNRQYSWEYSRDGYNYDRAVNGSDASTPGHN
jgi:hypothetical protein